MNTERGIPEDRIERIRYFEEIYQKLTEAIAALEKAFENWAALQSEMKELEEYYTGSTWRQDYEADEAGELPDDLKRGVLSQDGLYDLMTDQDRWVHVLQDPSVMDQ